MVLDQGGLNKNQILEIRGYGDRRLRDPENPYDYSNRRVSILVTPFTSDTARIDNLKVDTLNLGS